MCSDFEKTGLPLFPDSLSTNSRSQAEGEPADPLTNQKHKSLGAKSVNSRIVPGIEKDRGQPSKNLLMADAGETPKPEPQRQLEIATLVSTDSLEFSKKENLKLQNDIPAPCMKVGEVAAYLTISVAGVWRAIKRVPNFPQPLKIGNGSTRFLRSEVDAYIASRAVARSKASAKQQVKSERKTNENGDAGENP